jgi:hypothetical protein
MKKLAILIFTCAALISMSTLLVAQTYVGSQTCSGCHSGKHTDWKASGHPYKIQKLQNAQPPSYPAGLFSQKNIGPVSYSIQPGVPMPPKGYTWGTVGFVMGGYHSNARFLDTLGYLILGDTAQYNIPTQKWVRYTQSAPGTTPYTYACYKCHTTGPSQTKTPSFDAFPGIEGSWVEAGVGCEACHGPASLHISNPSGVKPPKEGLATCNNCHARDRTDTNKRVEWLPTTYQGISTGFIRHREQGDMMLASKHGLAGMTCATCHDPHKGVYYELGGLKASASCESCHANKSIPGHTSATCLDCHMPNAARNGDHLSQYVSEQSAHFWNILTTAETMFDNLDTTFVAGKKYIKVDGNGLSGLTLDYTCLQCHTDKDVNWAAQYAPNIHTLGIPVELKAFAANTNGKEVILSWSTATELNNKAFEIQRKFGTNEFATVGSVKGNGTTTSPNHYRFVDKPTDAGKYSYRLKQIDFDGTYEYSQVVEVDWTPALTFNLAQNYPNPFNPTTTFKFGITEKVNVKLSVLNLLGEEINVLVNEQKDAGSYSMVFNAANLPSGVYYYRLQAGNFVDTKKMLLLK